MANKKTGRKPTVAKAGYKKNTYACGGKKKKC